MTSFALAIKHPSVATSPTKYQKSGAGHSNGRGFGPRRPIGAPQPGTLNPLPGARRLNCEATTGFEPVNSGFADRRLRPLGYVAETGKIVHGLMRGMGRRGDTNLKLAAGLEVDLATHAQNADAVRVVAVVVLDERFGGAARRR